MLGLVTVNTTHEHPAHPDEPSIGPARSWVFPRPDGQDKSISPPSFSLLILKSEIQLATGNFLVLSSEIYAPQCADVRSWQAGLTLCTPLSHASH